MFLGSATHDITVKGEVVFGTVFDDENGNGKQDDGESGIADVPVQLNSTGGTPVIVTTDENGNYQFTGVGYLQNLYGSANRSQ